VNPISLFTACAPWLPLAELIPLAAVAGYQGLDLACKPQRYDPAQAPGFWSNNAAVIDLARLDEQVDAAAELLQAHGLHCPVLASYTPSVETATVERLIAAARRLGAPLLRLWIPTPEPGRIAEQFAAERARWQTLAATAGDLPRIVFETHDHTLCSGAQAARRLLDDLDPARVGVILDVANTLREGCEPIAVAIEVLGGFLAHVHVKNLRVLGDAAAWHGLDMAWAPLAEGNLDWRQILAALLRQGYGGWLAVENFSELEAGPSRIVEDCAWLRRCLRSAQALVEVG
jgi:sugar phosphate isomerase/epimerase